MLHMRTMMNYEKEAIDNLNCVIWIGSILIAAFAPLISIVYEQS